MSTNNELINSFQEYITKLSPLLYDIINEIVHNTFFLFTITTIISLIVLYRIYNFIVELLPVKVTCFYCNCDSEFTKPPKDQRIEEKWINNKPRYWWCRRCDNWNIINENGEIQDISELENIMDENLNQINTKYCENEEKLPINDYFCDTCKMHQEYIRQRLADYLPDEDHPEYEKYLDNLPQFKAHLERKYPIVCDECNKRVTQKLEDNQYKYRDLKLLLENRKKNQSFYKNLEESFIRISPIEQTFTTIKRYLKMSIIFLVISLCFVLGIIGIFWLSILLLKCFLEPKIYRSEMKPLSELLHFSLNDINISQIPFNKHFISYTTGKILGLDWSCAKLWSENAKEFDNTEEDDLMGEYLNSKIKDPIQSECPKQLWNHWFILCSYISCLFISLSYIEYLKNEIMLKPIFKKTTKKEFLWPIYSFITMNVLYVIWYGISSKITLFKYISLLYLLLFLKIIWDFSISTYIFISSTIQKPTPVVELKRTHSAIPGVIKNYDLLSTNTNKKTDDHQKTNSENIANEEEDTATTTTDIDDEFSVLLERQFKKSFSISTPHKNNHRYRDKKDKSKRNSKKNLHFSIKTPKIIRNYYNSDDDDEDDSDHGINPDSSFNINENSIFKEDEDEENENKNLNEQNQISYEDSPTKPKFHFNMKSNINNGSSLFMNKPLSSLPNYTYLSTKSKTGFFSQYNTNSNASLLNQKNKSGLWPRKNNNDDNIDSMDTDPNISNLNNYRNNESASIFEEDQPKSNPAPSLFGSGKNLSGGPTKLTKLTSYISSNNNNNNNNNSGGRSISNTFSLPNKKNTLYGSHTLNHNFFDNDDDLLSKKTPSFQKTDSSDQLTEIIQKSQKFFLPEEPTGLEDILSSIQVSSPRKSWKNFIHRSNSNEHSLQNNEKEHNTLLQLERNKEMYKEQYSELVRLIQTGCHLNLFHLLFIHSVLLLLDFIMDSTTKKTINDFQYFLFNRLYYLQVSNWVDFTLQVCRIGLSVWSAYVVLKALWKFSKFEQILYLEKRYWIRKLEQKKNNKTFGAALQHYTTHTNVDSNSSLLFNQYKPRIRGKIRKLLLILAITNIIHVLLIQPILMLHLFYFLTSTATTNTSLQQHLNIVPDKVTHHLDTLNINIYRKLAIHGFSRNEFQPKLNLIYIVILQFLPMTLSVLLLFTVGHWIHLVHTKND